MTTVTKVQVCIFLTASIFSISGAEIFVARDDGSLFPVLRSNPDFIRADGIPDNMWVDPNFEQKLDLPTLNSTCHLDQGPFISAF